VFGASSQLKLNDGLWHHVVGTWDERVISIYTDGILRGSGTNDSFGPILNTTYPVRIGSDARLPVGGDRFFNGLIDEPRIYNRALSANEIAGIFAAGSAGLCPSSKDCVRAPSGLVGWWPGEGNANDAAGENRGTIQNGVGFSPGKVGQAFSFDGVDDYID